MTPVGRFKLIQSPAEQILALSMNVLAHVHGQRRGSPASNRPAGRCSPNTCDGTERCSRSRMLGFIEHEGAWKISVSRTCLDHQERIVDTVGMHHGTTGRYPGSIELLQLRQHDSTGPVVGGEQQTPNQPVHTADHHPGRQPCRDTGTKIHDDTSDQIT